MNRRVKAFHRETIRGLIQKTVNLTLVDLEQRSLVPIRVIIDWTYIRTLIQGIDILYEQEIGSEAEEIALRNISIEIQNRTATIQSGIFDQEGYQQSLVNGIRAYSRHIKIERLTPQPHLNGFQQTLEDQFFWGITDPYSKEYQINRDLGRYRTYTLQLTVFLN